MDNYVNRIISEYVFSRLLYYKYKTDDVLLEEDVQFSNLTTLDVLGYKIEHLRTSYRVLYGILDKIANGVISLFQIQIEKKRGHIYFESFFHQYENDFRNIKNVHLAALYSLSLDLNQNDDDSPRLGSLGFFKKIRNEMEHNLIKISSNETNLEELSVNVDDLEKFVLALLQSTRSAIFSFVFLIRRETIRSEL